MKKQLLFLITPLALFSALSTHANKYVVTSTANGTTVDGVSLRWAITQANSNPGPDTITFNIAGRAPQMITLTSALPGITGANAGGTVIDGTTQPANGFTGVSPKIILNGNAAVGTGIGINAPKCAIYGLLITDFTSTGVQIASNATGFILGAPGKGNVINNMPNFTTGISISGVNGGTIQGNKVGTDTLGTHSSSVYTGISTDASTHNILIGGGGAGEGNLISGQAGPNSCNLYLSGSTRITVQGNIIGPDINGNFLHKSSANDGIYLFTADSCIIGGSGPGEGNIIGYNIDTNATIGGGIQNQSTHADLISRNSIFCNGNWGGIESIAGNNSFAAPVITSAYTNIINGTASPKAIVEVFYNQSGCTTTIYGCSGETYLGTVTTDLSGNWSLAGSFTGGAVVTATATDSANNTSAFANCFTIALTTTVIDYIYNHQVDFYPNPMSSSANLVLTDDLLTKDCEFSLYDVFGREIMKIAISKTTTVINKNNLANGIYFYRLISNGAVAGEGKLVVE